MKQLTPLTFKEEYYKEVEKEINTYFLDIIFKPLVAIVKKYIDIKLNVTGYLITAILNGTLQYNNGKFSGKFNSRLSKELKNLGARFNKITKTWDLATAKLPMDLSVAVGQAKVAYEAMNSEIQAFTRNINIDESLRDFETSEAYRKSLNKLEGDFRKTAKGLEVMPELTKEAVENLAKNYSNNLKLYIKDWTDKNIFKLREQVEANFKQGFRSTELIDTIKKNYNVSKNKAKFLASQETRLITAKYTQERYKSIGVGKYKWSTSQDSRVRDDHKDLNGKVITWDNPPIVDKNTGARAHAGVYFGCRCVQIPLVD